jgi:hypothetical protein
MHDATWWYQMCQTYYSLILLFMDIYIYPVRHSRASEKFRYVGRVLLLYNGLVNQLKTEDYSVVITCIDIPVLFKHFSSIVFT